MHRHLLVPVAGHDQDRESRLGLGIGEQLERLAVGEIQIGEHQARGFPGDDLAALPQGGRPQNPARVGPRFQGADDGLGVGPDRLPQSKSFGVAGGRRLAGVHSCGYAFQASQ